MTQKGGLERYRDLLAAQTREFLRDHLLQSACISTRCQHRCSEGRDRHHVEELHDSGNQFCVGWVAVQTFVCRTAGVEKYSSYLGMT